jgi:hypothetical protein
MKKQAGMAAVAVAAFIVGAATVGFLPHVNAQDSEVKKPKWHYGLSLMVRKADEPNFGKDTKRVGIEMFKDENNGNIIYVSETGSIAVLPAK